MFIFQHSRLLALVIVLLSPLSIFQAVALCATGPLPSPQATAPTDIGPTENVRRDARLRRNILVALQADRRINATAINVDVFNGVATLTGSVSSSREKRIASDVASHVSGVHSVSNRIQVITKSATPSARIQSRIDNMLRNDPLFNPTDSITVSVHSDVVELTGIVTSWEKHRAATRIAFDAGAKEVYTSLVVRDDPQSSARIFYYDSKPAPYTQGGP